MYRKILIGGATAAVIVGAGTAALATTGSDVTSGTPVQAAATSSTPSGSSSTSGKHHGRHDALRGALLRRAAHGQVVLKTKKGYQTVDFVNGSVTAVSASSISVQAGDKTTETYTVTKDTKVLERTKGVKGKPTASSVSSLAKGDHVVVLGTGTSTKTATRIVDVATK